MPKKKKGKKVSPYSMIPSGKHMMTEEEMNKMMLAPMKKGMMGKKSMMR